MNPRKIWTEIFQKPAGRLVLFLLVGGIFLAFILMRRGPQPKPDNTPVASQATQAKSYSFEQDIQPLSRTQATPSPRESDRVARATPTPKPPSPIPQTIFATREQSVSELFLPYGRLLRCELVNTVDSTNIDTPIIGLVIEDAWNDGRLIVPAGTGLQAGGQIYSKRLLERLDKDPFYVRVPASTTFYLYVTQTVDLGKATIGLSASIPPPNNPDSRTPMKSCHAIILLSLFAGCATRKEVRSMRPLEVPGATVAAEDMPEIRTSETVKAYPVGRYADPNFPEEMRQRSCRLLRIAAKPPKRFCRMPRLEQITRGGSLRARACDKCCPMPFGCKRILASGLAVKGFPSQSPDQRILITMTGAGRLRGAR